MSQTQSAHWLVTYDIADPRRLARVFKCMRKAGVPVQYSVFAVDASSVQMKMLMARLAKLIDLRADDVRAYRLPEPAWRATLGRAILPDGVLLE